MKLVSSKFKSGALPLF